MNPRTKEILRKGTLSMMQSDVPSVRLQGFLQAVGAASTPPLSLRERVFVGFLQFGFTRVARAAHWTPEQINSAVKLGRQLAKED